MKARLGRGQKNSVLWAIGSISLSLILTSTQAATIIKTASVPGFNTTNTNLSSSIQQRPPRNFEFARSSDFNTQESNHSKLDSASVLSTKVETARGCGIAPVSPSTSLPILKEDLISGEIGALIGGGAVAKAIAIAIAVAIAVHWWWIVKVAIAVAVWWWWYGGGEKKDEGYSYGWTTPVPVYGPPKPVYGAPQPTYGAPVSGYGRQLYESFDFSRLSEKVLKALDFFEKSEHYNSKEVNVTHPESSFVSHA